MSRPHPCLPFGTGEGEPLLFCLPFAGGGASAFVGWRRGLPDVAVAPVQYPGRETRLDEPCPSDAGRLVDEIATALAPHLHAARPYGLLGYSMGAKLAFALAQRLIAWGLPAPAALHVVAHRPPNAPSPVPGSARLPEAEFRSHVRAYGGTPDEVFDHPELAELLLPILRADFALAEQPVPDGRLACPVYAYAGEQDAAAPPDSVAGWARFTAAGFALRRFPGGHFFARGSADFLAALKGDVSRWGHRKPVKIDGDTNVNANVDVGM